MSKKPNTAEIERFSKRIESLFVLSSCEAKDQAIGLLELSYGWGEGISTSKLDRTMMKRLSKTYEWRSKEKKEEFERNESLVVDGYNRYIDSQKKNKWIV